MTKINLAISTCPNDTFAFHAILENQVDLRGLEFDIRLLDIQQLNDGLFAGQFDVAKASFHAAALLTEQTVVLPSGSALGFGVGPLLLSARPEMNPNQPTDRPRTVLCPGGSLKSCRSWKRERPISVSAFTKVDLLGKMPVWIVSKTWELAGKLKQNHRCRWEEFWPIAVWEMT